MAYTTIDDPSAYFNTVLWTGNGSNDREITGVGFQPDWTWIKGRTDVVTHLLVDSNRGADKRLISDTTDAEDGTFGILSFDTDGFSVKNSGNQNSNTKNYVGWSWKANAGSTSSNTDGSITSTVQANTTAGFSVVTYTGTGANATIGHGLGVQPYMIIVKNRTDSTNWRVHHNSIGATKILYLNLTNSQTTSDIFQNTFPTSSVFSVSSNNDVNGSSDNMIAYCFAEIEGYSKFGKYTGNSNADGTFIYTGFKPAWVMTKATFTQGDSNNYNWWTIVDNTRSPYNNISLNDGLFANSSNAEGNRYSGTGSGIAHMDFLSNGFKLRGSSYETNQSGTYIYMAFAEHPFVSSKGVPVTAR